MRVVLVCDAVIPALRYGGTERVVWWLGRKLAELGHEVTFLSAPGSSSDFASVLTLDPKRALDDQLPSCDVVHLNGAWTHPPSQPYVCTLHGNAAPRKNLLANTVFVSEDHARRHAGRVFVHHGLDIDAHATPRLDAKGRHLIFLGKAAWRAKNVSGAIRIAKRAGRRLVVAGGYRFNRNMGLRITLDRHVTFRGMVDDAQKRSLLTESRALLNPVVWNEPFGLAMIEAMYHGNPVIGTPFGSLPEIVLPDVGFLSSSEAELADALDSVEEFDPQGCHDYVCDTFNSTRMTRDYLRLYERVIAGERLHEAALVTPDPQSSTPKLDR